ncbi:MAG: hypothetical protein AAF799_16605 [Myxococcota bacterium]
MARAHFAALLAVSLALACSARPVDSDDEDESDSTDIDEAGVQPSEQGTMYSACGTSAECAPLEFCVFPQGETGFCTAACASPTNSSNCAGAPGNQELSCFDIGLADDRQVCALDCAATPCPRGMRCEAVNSGGTARSICF